MAGGRWLNRLNSALSKATDVLPETHSATAFSEQNVPIALIVLRPQIPSIGPK